MTRKSSDKTKFERHNRITSMLAMRSESSALSITDIWDQISKEGYRVDRKTVERDISELTKKYPGLQETGSNPVRFYFTEGFKLDYPLAFTEDQLQTIIWALGNLKKAAPTMIERLCTEVEDTLLSKLPENLQADFKKIKSFTVSGNTILGKSNDVDEVSFKTILQCLKDEVVFSCTYASLNKEPEDRYFAPLILQMSEGTPYLYIYDLKDMQIKTLRISRIKNARATDVKVNTSRAKEINMEYAIGGYGGRSDDTIIDYVVYGTKELATYFDEHIIHNSQKIEYQNGQYKVSFTMNDSFEIVRHLAHRGDFITKIEPEDVYSKVKEIWRKGLEVA